MPKGEFALHFLSNIEIGLFIIIITTFFTLFIVRRHVYSLYDPILFNFFLAAFGYSVVIYLFYFNLIDEYYFYAFILSQGAFFLGFFLNKPYNLNNKDFNYSKNYQIYKFIYPISFFLFFLSQSFVYIKTGIPLLMESRLETYIDGTGYGLIGRIIYVTSILSLSFSVYTIFFCKKRLFSFTVLIYCFIVAILSGSKGALLINIFIIALTLIFVSKFYGYKIIKQKILTLNLLFLFALIGAFFTLYIQLEDNSLQQMVYSFLFRFVNNGDVFFLSLPNNVLESLEYNNGFLALFKDILGAFRIIDWKDLPTGLGYQIYSFHYNHDILTGPNARHNIFGLFYFGFLGSVFFSFITGYLLSFIRNKLLRNLSYSPLNMSIYVILCITVNYINQDPAGLFIPYLFSTIIVFTAIYLIAFLLYKNSLIKR